MNRPITHNNLIEYLIDHPPKQGVCDHSAYLGWNSQQAEFDPPLVNIGQIDLPVNMESTDTYWGKEAPIVLSHYPYFGCEVLQCPRCGSLFFHYPEDGGHGRQLRWRLVRKELIDLDSLTPDKRSVVAKSYMKYVVTKFKNGSYELLVCIPLGVGTSVMHTLTPEEEKAFKELGIDGLVTRRKHMETNYGEYRTQSWR